MTIRIETMKGPLSDAKLQGICETFGNHDHRFAQIELNRNFFNENPAGYSIHSFAMDGDRAIGHYSIIPIKVIHKDRELLSGKGEALYLDPIYRNGTVKVDNKKVHIAVEMMNQTQILADQELLEPQHVITRKAVQRILRRLGSKIVEYNTPLLHFITNPFHENKQNKTLKQKLGVLGLFTIQRFLLFMVRLVFFWVEKPEISTTKNEFFAKNMAIYHKESCKIAKDKWLISRDMETMQWMHDSGLLDLFFFSDDPTAFVIIKKGHHPEVLFWAMEERRWGDYWAMLLKIIDHYSDSGPGMVISFPQEVYSNSRPLLRRFLYLCGFIPKPVKTLVALKSQDKDLGQKESVYFDRLFFIF
ncbi:MAG: hypothetical protein HQL70_09010 [Magnetococcales bacterium]|nr:hypothetical protein [Magnetococcales bacterium]